MSRIADAKKHEKKCKCLLTSPMLVAIMRRYFWGVAKSVRHGTLTPACVGSSPAAPTKVHTVLLSALFYHTLNVYSLAPRALFLCTPPSGAWYVTKKCIAYAHCTFLCSELCIRKEKKDIRHTVENTERAVIPFLLVLSHWGTGFSMQ